MIVVSDTGPLNYLILIGHVEVLPTLYISCPPISRFAAHILVDRL